MHGIPIGIIGECLTRVDDDLRKVIERFDSIVRSGREDKEWAKKNEGSTKGM